MMAVPCAGETAGEAHINTQAAELRLCVTHRGTMRSTHHHRFGHGRLEGVAEVQHPPLIVSEQDVLLMQRKEHGLTHRALTHIYKQRREDMWSSVIFLEHISMFTTDLPALLDLVAELLIGLVSHVLDFILASKDPVFLLRAVVKHGLKSETDARAASPQPRLSTKRSKPGNVTVLRQTVGLTVHQNNRFGSASKFAVINKQLAHTSDAGRTSSASLRTPVDDASCRNIRHSAQ